MSGLIVQEWFSSEGGSERVVDAMSEAFPDARIWALWNDSPGLRYPDRSVDESWLSRTPLRRHKASALPFMIPTWRTVPQPRRPEWLLCSSHLFAHHARVRQYKDVRKLVYVHTPARYIWNPELDERGCGPLPRMVSPMLRRIDRSRAQEAHKIAANSAFVRERIRSAWGRDADVIHPPVATERLSAVGDWRSLLGRDDRVEFARIPTDFVLAASRFVPYKRLDLSITAAEAAGLPLVIAGDGPEEGRLRAMAASARIPVVFIKRPSDHLLYSLYQNALALIFLSVEDFGLMPVEALALGTPVVGYQRGGVRESVEEGITGVLVTDRESPAELKDAVSRAVGMSPEACRRRALDFSTERFREAIKSWVAA